MGNIFTHVSVEIKGWPAEARAWLIKLVRLRWDEEVTPGDAPKEFREALEELEDTEHFGCVVEESFGGRLVISEDESASVDALSLVLQLVMARFDIAEPVGFEWSVQGDPNGGAVVVTKDGDHWMNTGNWLADKLDELRDPAGFAARKGGRTPGLSGARVPGVY